MSPTATNVKNYTDLSDIKCADVASREQSFAERSAQLTKAHKDAKAAVGPELNRIYADKSLKGTAQANAHSLAITRPIFFEQQINPQRIEAVMIEQAKTNCPTHDGKPGATKASGEQTWWNREMMRTGGLD